MYKHLVEIGLENYLNEYFFNQSWLTESYLEKINKYVGCFTQEQKTILKKKYSKISDHRSANDHFYELMVGYVFHPNGFFLDDNISGGSPDIVDSNVKIEIKAINAPAAEIEREKTIVPDSVSYGPFPDDDCYESRFTEKFNFRVNKAKRQISDSGFIYIIWNSTLKGWSKRKPIIEALLDNLSKEAETKCPGIKIKTICFEDLRELVDSRDAIKQ